MDHDERGGIVYYCRHGNPIKNNKVMADDDDRVIKDTDQATSSIAETSSSSSSSAAAAVVAARDQIPITPEGNDEGIDDDLERAQTAGGASYSAFTISQKRWIVVMVAIAA